MAGLRTIDLFCGAGGLSEGFRQAGFDVGLGLDIDSDSLTTLAHNHPGIASISDDVRQVSGRDLLEEAGFGEVDVMIGGPSCQGFSTQGRRGRWASESDPRNMLYREYARLVGELQPEWIVMENVPGLLYYDKGAFGAKVFAEFERQGYRIMHKVLLAADYGVPQLRKRLMIVGTRTDHEFRWPEQTHMGAVRRDAIQLWEERRRTKFPHLAPHRTLWQAISDLPPIRAGGGSEERPYSTPAKSDFQELMRRGSDQIFDHQAPPMPDVHLNIISKIGEGMTWRDISPDLLPDRFLKIRRTDGTNLFARPERGRASYTIITQFGNVTTGAYTHPLQDRAFSAREGARIQSFPDHYRFHGALTSKYRQIGNAVPPMLSNAIARSVLAAIAGNPAESAELQTA